jgi:cardiolipin synthase
MNLTVPNLITLLRMGLVPWFLIAVLKGDSMAALWIFIIAGISDALDGFIARFFNQRSALGAYLDPIADKILLTTAFVTLAIPGTHSGVLIPVWITVLVLARDLLILVISLVLFLVHQVDRFPPARISKATTAVQIGAVVLVLASGVSEGLSELTSTVLYAAGIFTVASGLNYIWLTNRLVVEKQGA